jgi:cobalamin biosynthesis protein CobT
MSFSFTIPYITFLGLTLLIIIGITIFLIRRMNNQNQKFSSIVGVVTSLAEELNSIKMCISNSFNNISNISTNTKTINTNLIPVSDDDEEDDEDDDEEEDDNDQETDEDDEEDNEQENNCENENDENNEEETNFINTEKINQIINIKDKLLEEPEVKYIYLETSKEENCDIFEMISQEENLREQMPIKEINLKEEDIIQGSTIEETQVEELLTDINSIKPEVIDYKKMSLTKLRTIILEKGLSDHNISKLKKNDLLQILESNLHN